MQDRPSRRDKEYFGGVPILPDVVKCGPHIKKSSEVVGHQLYLYWCGIKANEAYDAISNLHLCLDDGGLVRSRCANESIG